MKKGRKRGYDIKTEPLWELNNPALSTELSVCLFIQRQACVICPVLNKDRETSIFLQIPNLA